MIKYAQSVQLNHLKKMDKLILSRHVYIGEADRHKPCGCVDHGVKSMRVASIKPLKSVRSGLHAPAGRSYSQIAYVLHLSY